MKLVDFKNTLKGMNQISIELPDGSLVPAHFHVTEVGKVSKHFIDCGSTIRTENKVNFQLWEANDYNHRLHPEKLLSIIELSESKLGLNNDEIEVEYQGSTINKFGIDFKEDRFLLTTLSTDCLAIDKCGIPDQKAKKSLASLSPNQGNSCKPNSGCC